jgi:hypothetical protein
VSSRASFREAISLLTWRRLLHFIRNDNHYIVWGHDASYPHWVSLGWSGLEWLSERRLGLFIRHLEEQQVGELLDVIAVADPVIPQDVAVIPHALDDGGGFGGHFTDLQVVMPQMVSSLGKYAKSPSFVVQTSLNSEIDKDESPFFSNLTFTLISDVSLIMSVISNNSYSSNFLLWKFSLTLTGFISSIDAKQPAMKP